MSAIRKCDGGYVERNPGYFRGVLHSFVSKTGIAHGDFVKQTVDDLYENLLVSAHQSAGKFNPEFSGRAAGDIESRCKAWLWKICQNITYTWQRKNLSEFNRRVDPQIIAGDQTEKSANDVLDALIAKSPYVQHSDSPEQSMMRRARFAMVDSAMHCLSDRRRRMIRMWLEELDDRSIAEQIGSTQEVVRAERHRAIKHMGVAVRCLESDDDGGALTEGLSQNRRDLIMAAAKAKFDIKATARSLSITEAAVADQLPSALTRLWNLTLNPRQTEDAQDGSE